MISTSTPRPWLALLGFNGNMAPPLNKVRERRQVGPEIEPTPALNSCIPAGMHAPTCVFWAGLRPCSLKGGTSHAGLMASRSGSWRGPFDLVNASSAGLGHTVAVHRCPSTSCQIC
jgi:hypothetical protein